MEHGDSWAVGNVLQVEVGAIRPDTLEGLAQNGVERLTHQDDLVEPTHHKGNHVLHTLNRVAALSSLGQVLRPSAPDVGEALKKAAFLEDLHGELNSSQIFAILEPPPALRVHEVNHYLILHLHILIDANEEAVLFSEAAREPFTQALGLARF